MSAWTNGTYTHKGLALLAKLTQGNSLKITKAVSGTGYVTPANLANQTAVTGAKQQLTFQAASYPSAGTCKLPMFLTNKGVTTGYKAKQIGLYAYDPVEGEILYFIAQSANGTEVPSESEMPDYSATWTFYFRYGQADNVDVTVDPSHTVTTDMLNEVRAIAESGVSTAKQGEVVVCENSANLPFAGLRIFGKSTQNGVPAPENPVEILSVVNPTIGVTGKNLLPIGTVTFEVTEMYTPEVPIPAGEYWLSCNIESTDTDGNYSTIVFLNNGQNVLYLPLNRGDVSRKITLKDSVDRVQLCAAYNNTQGVGDTATWSNIQLECSDKFTGYEAYKQPRTITLVHEMNGIPVDSGGNYTDENGQQWICDEIDFARGVYVQRIIRRVLNGSEAWSTNNGCVYYLSLQDMKKGGDTDGAYLNAFMFDSYPNSPTWNAIATTQGVACLYWHESWEYGRIAIHEASCATVDEWTAHLSANNVVCIYTLSTPVVTALTTEELSAFAAMTSHNPVTTVMNDGGAWMEVDCIKAQNEAAFRRAVFGNILTPADYGETLPATATAGRLFFKKVT